jgi:hypothetical protein
LSPCHVSPSKPYTRLPYVIFSAAQPATICCIADLAWLPIIVPFSNTHPLFNLNNVGLAFSVAALRMYACTPTCRSALPSPLSCHQTLSLATTPYNPQLPIYRRPFHPLLPEPAWCKRARRVWSVQQPPKWKVYCYQ